MRKTPRNKEEKKKKKNTQQYKRKEEHVTRGKYRERNTGQMVSPETRNKSTELANPNRRLIQRKEEGACNTR